MSNHILITGGSGLLGKQLTNALLKKGHTICHLSRKEANNTDVKTYLWNVEQGIIDPNCIKGVDTIVHLAGEGIADEKWTAERKKKLIKSRTKSIGLIYGLLKTQPNIVTSVISASAIGYYGDRENDLMTENSTPGTGFLSECCVKWEQAVDAGIDIELRVVKLRIGVILSKQGGALPKLAAPVRYGFGTVLGTGKQWVPWIHIQDMVNMFVMAIENNNLVGAYNAVAPFPVTNYNLTQALAQQFNKHIWMPNVPVFAFKLLLGEMSLVVLGSTKVSPNKIEKAGYNFLYLTLDEALNQIYKKRLQ